jgi:hypothetical protein
MRSITTEDEFIAARRELQLRRHVYPGLVRRGKMTQEVAEHELAVMEQIMWDYEQQVQDEYRATTPGKQLELRVEERTR